MLYVVDGHNLIGKAPGLSLDMLDDEDRLLELLRPFVLAKKGRKIEVFFDKAAPGRAGVRAYGSLINAHYVPASTTADDAIAAFLQKMGRAAKNGVCVVSSDHRVQASARSARAEVMLSEAFVEELLQAKANASAAKGGASAARSALSEASLSEHEVADWLRAFHIDPAQADRPIEPPPTQKKVGQGAQKRPKQPAKPRARHGFPQKKP